MDKDLNEVKTFWESNPLWTGESEYPPGTKEFFEEHRKINLDDGYVGEFDLRILPEEKNRERVLDLGCGPAFWMVELAERGCRNITGADLTGNALKLAKTRLDFYGIKAMMCQQNAEKLGFADNSFTHVNCQGVIHHTPDTQACVREIARVLKPGGTACISVYYKNIFLKFWPLYKGIGKIVHKMGGGLKGRGRESIFSISDVNEIVRLYDGENNPVGKAYDKNSFLEMLSPYFKVEETFLHFFPARAFPFRVPKFLHKMLDKNAGFLIYAFVRKP